ncbi:MAG TPA: YlmC/YmxH family sporulation protein [Bacillota bacterium]|nr:YlmC/YmxH family sporulation protein [Bacillota bacterium]
MPKSSDFRVKEVINIRDGRRLGNIIDMEFNLIEGRISAIIVPGSSKWMGLLKSEDDIVIPWERIKKIGDDVILVDIEGKRYL